MFGPDLIQPIYSARILWLKGPRMTFLKMLFAWWDHATLGTLLYTALHGVAVGADASGNRYYQTKDGKRRWVL